MNTSLLNYMTRKVLLTLYLYSMLCGATALMSGLSAVDFVSRKSYLSARNIFGDFDSVRETGAITFQCGDSNCFNVNEAANISVHKRILTAIHTCAIIRFMRSPGVLQFPPMRGKYMFSHFPYRANTAMTIIMLINRQLITFSQHCLPK